mmetsp:Transcript_28734/g.37708  ORF Transcript_28734/g.37708 Transcript_28734/m.37708 type:complete len:307 (-) Transcript_28734:320-1240(-)
MLQRLILSYNTKLYGVKFRGFLNNRSRFSSASASAAKSATKFAKEEDAKVFEIPERIESKVKEICKLRKDLSFDEADNECAALMKGLQLENLFSKYAAPHFKDESFSYARRGFAVVPEMTSQGLEVDAEIVRAVLDLCTHHKLWFPALEFFEWLQRQQPKQQPSKFVYDELLQNLQVSELEPLGDILYEFGIKQGVLEEPLKIPGSIDLHEYTVPTALATVRIALFDMVRKPPDRKYHDPTQSGKLNLITGQGNRSENNEAKIKPAVEALLQNDFNIKYDWPNPGMLALQQKDLFAWTERVIKQCK